MLHSLCLLDTPVDPTFDRLTRLTARLLEAPIAIVSLVDRDRQFFKSQIGLPEPYASLRETPLTHSFCQHAVATQEPLIIEDSREHPLVGDNLAIEDLDVVAYLGIPLITSENVALGTLCAIDDRPKSWSDADIQNIKDLAQSVVSEIELRSELRLRRRTQTQLQEQERFMSHLLSTMQQQVMVVDLTSDTIIYSNDKLSDLLGLKTQSSDNLTMHELRNRLHADDQAFVHTLRRKYRCPEDKQTMHEVRLSDAHDQWHVFHVWGTVFAHDSSGEPEQIMCVWQDVTHQKKMEDEVRQMEIRELQSKLLRDFIRNTSHDLRTPLSSIQMKVDLIERNPEGDKLPRRLTEIQSQLKHVRDILDEFQTLSTLLGEQGLNLISLDINAELRKAVQYVRREHAPSAALTVDYDLMEEIPSIRGDEAQLQQALQRVIENALLYTDADGTIVLRTRYEQQQVIIEVEDDGQGIPEEAQSQIFEPFYKVNAARTLNASGAGIGLSIVKRVVEWHNGDIQVESEPEAGTTVRIVLPLEYR